MKEKEYLLIDSVDYLEYFMNELKEQYIPITTDIYIKSFFESKGIKTIGILDYLSKSEVKKICLDTSLMVDYFIDELDKNNGSLYKGVFGREEIRLFYATMKYLFKRFAISSFQFIKGIELIIQRNDIARLSYLHNGNLNYLCGNANQNSFFFPDDVCWRIMQYWDSDNKPEMIFLKAPLRKFTTNAPRYNLRDYLYFFKKFIKRIIRCSHKYSPSKRILLFLSPLYDLSFAPDSVEMHKEYNIINWDVDYSLVPQFLKGQPVRSFFKFSEKERMRGINCNEIVEALNFDIEGLKKLLPMENFRFLPFATPLIQDFLKKKLSNIIRYWRAIENLHKPTTKIDVVFWGNSPIRYPAGIVTEFCRLNKIPIVGMQHGGMYGSNLAESTYFDLDFEKCDFYFSYGFNVNDLKKVYPDKKRYPEIIPVGSTKIFDLATTYKPKYKKKTKVKAIYVLEFFQHFFWKAEFIVPYNELFHFQKQIADLLKLDSKKNRIMLKFIPGYFNQPLRLYIDSIGSHDFEIVDKISFKKILEKYEPEFLLLDVCSTALNESCSTKSNIIVYNDQHFAPLAEDAFQVLNKRAIVCNSHADFLKNLKSCFGGKIPERDLENREFLEKYCICKGVPQDNIRRSVSHTLRKTSTKKINAETETTELRR